MRLILILIVLVIVGWLTANAFKSQTNAVSSAARQAGVDVPQSATPREQVEAVGKAIEKIQADQAEQQRRQLDAAEKGQ
jgi:Tfp pilus assembly protein PilE